MKLFVIDHTEKDWNQKYIDKRRENGAMTYSKDIVEYHIPVWREELKQLRGGNFVIGTCRLLDSPDLDLPNRSRLVVQYLHTYDYDNPLANVEKVVKNIPTKYDRLVFVTAYRSFAEYLVRAGYEAIFLPMSIDIKRVERAKSAVKSAGKRVIYFGNVLRPKEKLYERLRQLFVEKGWTFDTISHNRFNRGDIVSQLQAWTIISAYDYGIGVGRCALEMMALGLKVMVAGENFGGLITNQAELELQLATNINGRITTFDRSIEACINCFDLSIIPNIQHTPAIQIVNWIRQNIDQFKYT